MYAFWDVAVSVVTTHTRQGLHNLSLIKHLKINKLVFEKEKQITIIMMKRCRHIFILNAWKEFPELVPCVTVGMPLFEWIHGDKVVMGTQGR